jgi:predicted SnoaL-like aldol condensation-catalyzing enzyme
MYRQLTIDHIVAQGDNVFVMYITKTTNKQIGKRVVIKSADLYRIDNEVLAEHWDAVEATAFPNRKISEL